MAAKVESSVLFDVEAALPHKVLTEATQAALEAARAALAPAGRAEATGRLGSAKDGTRRVRIELTLHVDVATAALGAERAFAEAFLARLTRQGFTGERA